jgi:hypothetical protein
LASFIKGLVHQDGCEAEKIVLGMDNLNTQQGMSSILMMDSRSRGLMRGTIK